MGFLSQSIREPMAPESIASPRRAFPRPSLNGTPFCHLGSRLISSVSSRKAFLSASDTLKVVLAEGGFAWIVPLLWRFDNHYKEMRMEVPWMTRRPLDYLADHVRITTQPAESPDNPKHLLQLLEMVNAVDFLIYSSDYPHFDFDSPRRALPKLSDEWHRRIFFENAAELYGLARSVANEPTHVG